MVAMTPASLVEVRVPDIGDFKDVPIIEVLVKPGDLVSVNDTVATLESEKATLDVPSSAAGTILSVEVVPGHRVSKGSILFTLQPRSAAGADSTESTVTVVPPVAPLARQVAPPVEVRVPDIGDFQDIPIIEVRVKSGDVVSVDDTIATLESEKATLDVPSSAAGTVLNVVVEPGHRVSKGSILLTLLPEVGTLTPIAAPTPVVVPTPVTAPVQNPPPAFNLPDVEAVPAPVRREPTVSRIYASPSVRRVGREFGVDLATLKGSGRGGRILTEDLQQFVRQKMSRVPQEVPQYVPSASPTAPPIDFSRFGEVERQPLSRIRKISGTVLAKNWATIPHVTNFDEADVTELDQFRQALNAERKDGLKLTLLSFLVKAVAATLKAMPHFNASLDGDVLVLKKYVNVGVAVDTPGGLLVPVVKSADKLGLLKIAESITASAASARDGKLKLADMEGGSFTISSLGGIGGTGFTPIINAPELAILGAGKAAIRPRWDGAAFLPRLILPISLSWDHRALDGVAAAQFLVLLVRLLEDFRRIAL